MVLILDGYLKDRSAGKNQSLLFNLFKAFFWNEISHKSDVFSPKRPIFLHACAVCSELPTDIDIDI